MSLVKMIEESIRYKYVILSNHTSNFWQPSCIHTLKYWVYESSHLLNLNSSFFKPIWDFAHLIDLDISPQIWVSPCPRSITDHLLLPHQPDYDTTIGSWKGSLIELSQYVEQSYNWLWHYIYTQNIKILNL
jgi:hypothetical protein